MCPIVRQYKFELTRMTRKSPAARPGGGRRTDRRTPTAQTAIMIPRRRATVTGAVDRVGLDQESGPSSLNSPSQSTRPGRRMVTVPRTVPWQLSPAVAGPPRPGRPGRFTSMPVTVTVTQTVTVGIKVPVTFKFKLGRRATVARIRTRNPACVTVTPGPAGPGRDAMMSGQTCQ
jgi:hypothetical protein